MEIKTIKQEVCVNNIITKQAAEQGIDVDFTLPDYCPGVSRILKCKLMPRIASKGISGQNLTIDGTAAVLVLYADDGNRIFSYEYVVPFTKSIELPYDGADAQVYCRARCAYANCRAVTDRKLDVHGAVEMDIKVICPKRTEIITDADDSEIQLRRGSAPATNPMGIAEKSLIIEEEIEIGQGQPEIRSIIRYEAVPAVTDCKIINGKVLLKGELAICMLYCPADSTRPLISRSTVPFSQIMDIDGVNEECECENRLDIAYFELKPKSTAAEEARTICVNAKLIITTQAYCENDIPVILDAYCTRHKAEISKSEIAFDKISCAVNESYICKKSLEFSDDALGSVLDMWCETQLGGVRIDDGMLIISGSVQACMLIYDAAGNATYQERPIEFEYKHSLDYVPQNMHCDPQLEVLNSSFTITGANTLEVRVDLRVSAAVYETKKLPLIVELNVSDELREKNDSDGALIVYYADAGEQVWDIARKYSSSIDEIMQMNSLGGDTLSSDQPLLIPIC